MINSIIDLAEFKFIENSIKISLVIKVFYNFLKLLFFTCPIYYDKPNFVSLKVLDNSSVDISQTNFFKLSLEFEVKVIDLDYGGLKIEDSSFKNVSLTQGSISNSKYS